MKIVVRKKKNLKRLIKEDLEVHMVDGDLSETTPEESYGDGYEAGREYTSEEQELDEEFSPEDILRWEGGRNIIPTKVDSPAAKAAKAKSDDVAAQIRNARRKKKKRDAVVKQRAKNVQQLKDVGAPKNIQQLSQKIKDVDMRNLSRQGGKAWEQFPRHYRDAGPYLWRGGARHKSKNANLPKKSAPAPSKKNLRLKLRNPSDSKGMPFDASFARETASQYDPKKLRSLSYKLRGLGPAALKGLARQMPELILTTVLFDIGMRQGTKIYRHYKGLDNMAGRGGPKTPEEQSAFESVLSDWANTVDLGYGDETFFKSPVERAGRPYAGADEEEVIQARERAKAKKETKKWNRAFGNIKEIKIEVKNKKNLKRLIKESLEVHRVPDDLGDATPEEAYGDGYDAGREYSSEEDECGFDSKKIKITVGKREIISEGKPEVDPYGLTVPSKKQVDPYGLTVPSKKPDIPPSPRQIKQTPWGYGPPLAAAPEEKIKSTTTKADKINIRKGPPPVQDPVIDVRLRAHKPSKRLSPSAWADAGFSNVRIDPDRPTNWYRSTGKTPGPANIGQQALKGVGKRALGRQIAQAAARDLRLAASLAVIAVIFDTSSRAHAKISHAFRKMNQEGGPRTEREKRLYDKAESHIKNEIGKVNKQLNLEMDPKWYDKSIATNWKEWADVVDLGYGDRTKDPRIGTVAQDFLQKHDMDALGAPEYEGVDIKGKPFLKKMAQAYLKRYKLDPKLARYFSHKELKNLRDEQLFIQDGGEVDVSMLTPLKTPEGREEFIKNAKDRWWKQSMAAAAEGSEGHAGEAQPRFGLDESVIKIKVGGK